MQPNPEIALIATLAIGSVVVVTSAFVYFDAHRIGMKKDLHLPPSIMNNSPVGWFVGCLLLWIVVFPLYFVARSRFKAQGPNLGNPVEIGGHTPSSTVPVRSSPHHKSAIGATALGLGVASIPLGVLIGVLATPLWLAAIVMGAVGLGKKVQHADGSCTIDQHALWGLITGVVGFLTMVAAIIVMIRMSL